MSYKKCEYHKITYDVDKYTEECPMCKIDPKPVTLDKPKPLEKINIDEIIEMCQAHIDYLYSEEYHEDNDEEQYVYDSVLQAVYGKDIFTKLNKEVFI